MIMFQKGDRVRYHTLAGEYYNAVVTGARELPLSGAVMYDLDIELPGNREPFHTTAVRSDRVEPLASPRSAP